MISKPWRLSACCCGALFAAVPAADAGPLAVLGTQAQAYSFTYRDVCWALFPEHITPRGEFDITTPTPSRTGRVEVVDFMRVPELDLALGEVVGDASRDCAPVISDPTETGFSTTDQIADLTTVRQSGDVERTPVRISVTEYAHLGLDPIDPDMKGRLGQGRSGSVVVSNDLPVAMMIDLPGDELGYGAEIRALRMDAALTWLSRYLDQQNISGSTPSIAQESGQGIPYEVVAWSATPYGDSEDPRSLATRSLGPYLIPPNSLPATIEIEVDRSDLGGGGEALVIGSDVEDGAATAPRDVELYIQRRRGGVFSYANDTTISQSGEGRIPIVGQSFAALRLRIVSSWDPSKPVRIDQVEVLARPD